MTDRRREVGDRGGRLDPEQVGVAAGARDAVRERPLERHARHAWVAPDHERDVLLAVPSKHDRRGSSEGASEVLGEVPPVSPPDAVGTEQAPHPARSLPVGAPAVATHAPTRRSARRCETRGMSGRLVRILTTPDVFEGVIVRSRLEDEGIPVMTNGGEGPYRMGPVHVYVPAEFEVQARLVIETLRAGGGDLADATFDDQEAPTEQDGTTGTNADGTETEERA